MMIDINWFNPNAARAEALEALRVAVVELNQRFTLEPLIARIEALEATQHAHVERKHQPSSPPPIASDDDLLSKRPGKRLWERMEEAGRRELADNPMVKQAEFYQAMIREVAAALIEWQYSDDIVRSAWEVAKWLQREADRG